MRERAKLGPARAVAWRAFADARVRTTCFGILFAAVSYIQPVTYRRAYPKLSDRVAFAHSFGDNKAIRLFYGAPHDLLTVGGYTAWRVGGTLAIFAAVWGLLAAVRALRAEEDAGRAELVLAGIVGRRAAYVSALTAIAVGAAVLWLAEFAGLVAASLPAGDSAELALAVASVVPVFAGVGALASQLAPTRRVATELCVAVLGLSFMLRVVADTSRSLGGLRWITPLGWAEDVRPFAGPRPLVLLLPLAASAVLLTVAMCVALRRDVGSGLLAARDSGRPRLTLLSSPTAQALRLERGSLIVWLSGVAGFAFVIGAIANSISSAGVSKSLERELEKLGAGSILTPTGYLGFTFLFFVLAASLFGVSHVAAARGEEAGEQLETLLALPVARARWLGGRLVLAAAGAAVISLAAGVLAWAGAVSAGARISLPRMLEAGANCLPPALLFVGVAALCYGLIPRASTGLAYAFVSVSFLWQLFGALLGAPRWLVDLSPFQHVGLVPAQPFRAGAAAAMLAIAVITALAAIGLFRRRDLLAA
jgi:ABC-2 type transport system permease protein